MNETQMYDRLIAQAIRHEQWVHVGNLIWLRDEAELKELWAQVARLQSTCKPLNMAIVETLTA